jgi:leucyl aminopeptidase
MSMSIEISFSKSAKVTGGLVVALGSSNQPVPAVVRSVDPGGQLDKAVKVAGFSGKLCSTADVIAPVDAAADRIALVGAGEPGKLSAHEWMRIGGKVFTQIRKTEKVTILLGDADAVSAEAAADMALGLLMRAYSFDLYKTKKKDDDDTGTRKCKVIFQHEDAAACKKAFASRQAVADGVKLARDLVNEPANVLGPVEFAARAKELEALGMEVEILTEKEMKKLKMEALLGVSLGSVRPPRLAIMKWQGGKAKDKPVAFVGKGVTFDTGGISIKPAGGMEDMKGDMGGAAAVTGLMHTLAARKAKVNAIGIIGLVENMPDGAAQRPGDIVRSMSGQTIEIINTDAEGRLVLCDALTYCQDRFKPAVHDQPGHADRCSDGGAGPASRRAVLK